MFKAMTAVLFAALIVAATSFAPGVSEAVEPPAAQKSLKGDRLQIRAPDRTQPATRARETRVVMIDRLSFGLC